MAIFLLTLRVIGIILLVLLAIIILLLVLPVGVKLDYKGGEFSVKATVLFLKIKVYPQPEKSEKAKKKEQNKKQAKEQKNKKSKQAGNETKPKKKLDLHITLETVLGVIATAGSVMKRFFAALHFRKIRLYLPVGGKDAADAAIRYGKTSAWAYSLQAGAQNLLDLEFEEFRIEPDFAALGTGEQKNEHFSCKITTQLYIMVITAIYAIVRLKKTGII